MPRTTCQHHAPASCDGRARASYMHAHAPTMYDGAALHVVPSATFLPRFLHSVGGSYTRAHASTRYDAAAVSVTPQPGSASFLPRTTSSRRLVHAAHAWTRYAAAGAPSSPARRSYLAPHSSQRLVHTRARVDHVRRSRRVRRATTRQYSAPVPRTTVDPAACTPALARRRRTTHSGRARRCPSSMASTAVGPSCRRMTFRPRATV